MKRPLRNAMVGVLALSGLLAIGLGTKKDSQSHTDGAQQISDVSYGLASSPVYTQHLEEPVGGAIPALDRGEGFVIKRDRRWNYLSLSALLVIYGVAVITWSLLLLIRAPKPTSGSAAG